MYRSAKKTWSWSRTSAGRRGRSWSGRRGRKKARDINHPMKKRRKGQDKTKVSTDIPAVYREGRGAYGGGIDGHPVERIRRCGETSKAVVWSTIRVTVTVVVVAAVSVRVAVLLAFTRAEDTAHDSTDNHEDGNWDANLEPISLGAFGRGCA